MDDDLTAAIGWAEWLGARALPAYLAGLALVLAAAWLAAAAIRHGVGRTGWPVDPPARAQAGFLLWIAIGFAVVVAGAAVFAEMLEALDADEALGHFDTRLAEVLAASASPAVLRAFAAVTRLGDPLTLTAIVAVVAGLLLVRGRRWLAVGWVVAAAGGGLLNRVLKGVIERARPLHEHGFAVADGFSFPSGHTSGSLVVYGMLAYLALRLLPPPLHLPAVLGSAALAYTMGVSRVILQVHWASDVVAGFASGAAWLVVCLAGIESLRRRPWRRRQERQAPGAS